MQILADDTVSTLLLQKKLYWYHRIKYSFRTRITLELLVFCLRFQTQRHRPTSFKDLDYYKLFKVIRH